MGYWTLPKASAIDVEQIVRLMMMLRHFLDTHPEAPV
jgi:hypothetical protein